MHSPTETDFWVHHDATRDLVVAGGARLEVAASGEIASVAWDLDLARRNEPIVGALMVPARLGGGFVLWSHRRVFRAHAFTGPLDPVASQGIGSVRGARSGADAVLIFTENGPRELAPGAMALRASREPGLLDAAALDDGRRARLDVFGRASASADGKRFVDLTPAVGLAARHVAVGEGELWIDTFQDRFPVRADGTAAEPVGRPIRDGSKLFQVAWRDLRANDRSEMPWTGSPVAAAIAGGGDVGDGTAFGVVQGTPVRIDLRTGKVVAAAGEWTPNGLVCQPVRAPDALLFACSSAVYTQRGSYLLRSVGGAPPELERAFSGEGQFVSNDDGNLAFLGSCVLDTRPPEEPVETQDSIAVSPVICLRRGAGDWVERRVDLDDGATLLAWALGANGSAAALVAPQDPLPQPASPAGRVTERAGVRVVQVDREQQGFAITRSGVMTDDGGGSVDRRFHLRDDGSIDAWLAPSQDTSPSFVVGATLDPQGALTLHAVAPGMITSIGTGRFGLSISRDGELHETLDHGRTFRRAGVSPVPPSAFSGASCSALGCALGSVTRVGWSEVAANTVVLGNPLPEPPAIPPATRIACRPAGDPVPLERPRDAPAGSRMAVSTGWGEPLDVIRDAGAKEPVTPPTAPPPAPPPLGKSSVARSKRTGPASPAVLRTHTLVVRAPFSPRGVARRLNATDGSFTMQKRSMVTPLLGPKGEVELLIGGDGTELLVAGDRISAFPWQDGRRYGRNDSATAGITIAPGRALILGEVRRRLSLEERGLGVGTAPLLIGTDIDPQRRRPLTLGRRDDGAIGVLVLDGPAPETAGAAIVDRVTGTVGAIAPLAPWSTLVAGDDAVCRAADPGAFRALLVIDPSVWLSLDPAALSGLELGHQGIVMVRWGRERVCLEALDATLGDQRTRGVDNRAFRLVVRWTGDADRGAALRTTDLRQDLVCRVGR